MSQPDRFERLVTDWLRDAAQPRTPDYFQEVLAQTARTRQRPAWTFPERWLPMSVIARQRILLRPIPWRAIALALALIAVLVAGLIAVGASSRHLPAPFGPAANGAIAYSSSGDIYTVDPRTGFPRAVVTGPAIDVAPIWSLDGTHLVFQRKITDGESPSHLYVARADGSELTLITPTQMAILNNIYGRAYSFSPDGRDVLISHNVAGSPTLSIAKADGSGIRSMRLYVNPTEASFRPRDGAQILFIGTDPANPDVIGLYMADADGANLRALIKPSSSLGIGFPRWSPDGSQIAYTAWDPFANVLTARIHVISADGTGDRPLPLGKPAIWEGNAAWSNDGSRLVAASGHTADNAQVYGAIVPADGSGPGVETDQALVVDGGCCVHQEWSPDDRSILATPADVSQLPLQQILWDPATGHLAPAKWTAVSGPAWQRLAP